MRPYRPGSGRARVPPASKASACGHGLRADTSSPLIYTSSSLLLLASLLSLSRYYPLSGPMPVRPILSSCPPSLPHSHPHEALALAPPSPSPQSISHALPTQPLKSSPVPHRSRRLSPRPQQVRRHPDRPSLGLQAGGRRGARAPEGGVWEGGAVWRWGPRWRG